MAGERGLTGHEPLGVLVNASLVLCWLLQVDLGVSGTLGNGISVFLWLLQMMASGSVSC